ncbi:MAG: hypothetical protein WBG17_01895, partial [Burkholderiaceae bacterium]
MDGVSQVQLLPALPVESRWSPAFAGMTMAWHSVSRWAASFAGTVIPTAFEPRRASPQSAFPLAPASNQPAPRGAQAGFFTFTGRCQLSIVTCFARDPVSLPAGAS